MSDELDKLERNEVSRLAIEEGVSIEHVPGAGNFKTEGIRHRIRRHRSARKRETRSQVASWIGAIAAIIAAVFSVLAYSRPGAC